MELGGLDRVFPLLLYRSFSSYTFVDIEYIAVNYSKRANMSNQSAPLTKIKEIDASVKLHM